MRFTANLCMPEGDGARETYRSFMALTKADNRRVIRAMLRDGIDVPDTVGELGLEYRPEQRRRDANGEPLMEIRGMYHMLENGFFSCGCAAAYEGAVLEEKYGILTECEPVPQGDDDFHAIVITEYGAFDPVANYLRAEKMRLPNPRRRQTGIEACRIVNGKVICDEPTQCCVDERGVWSCPAVPGLTGKREKIGPIQRSPKGQAWARTKSGAVVPVCRRAR